VIGPQAAVDAGAPIDQIIAEGDMVKLGSASFEVWETPGHSAGHICFVSREAKLALVGDVLFPMGCGRVFLGAAGMAMMWRALSRLKALPDDVSVITGHDYTLSNARFAAAMDPANSAVIAALAEAETAKAAGRFWSVTTIGAENPFLRAGEPALAAAVGMVGRDAGDTFTALREAKNKF
jgi:hydroxyacylglutathione hydrolase